MLGSTVLEIIIVLVFIFLIYSLFATIIVEIIASTVRLRARNLRSAVCRMLQDTPSKGAWRGLLDHLFLGIVTLFNRKAQDRELVSTFYERPSIKYLSRNNLDSAPSYIEPEAFAQTLLDILIREPGANELDSIKTALGYDELFDTRISISQEEWEQWQGEIASAENKEQVLNSFLLEYTPIPPEPRLEFSDSDFAVLLTKLRSTIGFDAKYKLLQAWTKEQENNRLYIEPETRLQLSLLLREASEDIANFKMLMMNWFEQTMERSKGWYKKKIAFITFFIGIGIAISFNVDTVFIVKELKENIAVREALMAEVELFSNQTSSIQMNADLRKSVKENASSINDLLSLSDRRNTVECFWWALAGWLLTALAISFGAPFWFDLLNKLMKLRTSEPVQMPKEDVAVRVSKSQSNNVPRIAPKG